jgi:uncharacterized membrane protein YphA (DoxX/SURF4 family)
MKSEFMLSLVRISLGIIFVVGGLKLALPTLFGVPGHEVLAQGYIDPQKGWISPFFAQKITDVLGVPISSFLAVQGWIEMLVGLVMILGIFTPMVAVSMGLMFWSFTVANPVLGEIRLSRDLALAGLCAAVALAGGIPWSLDRHWRQLSSMYAQRKSVILILVRLSLAFTLIASALFFGGVLDNPLNTTLPPVFVLVIGGLLGAGIFPRWIMFLVFLWMLYLLPVNVYEKGLFSGLDAIKRELGFLTAAFFYFMSGPDRWTWPKPSLFRCRNVVDLTLGYLEGTLDPKDRKAMEAHLSDCSNCWNFLNTYRETIKLGQSLKEQDIPSELRERLQTFLAEL